MSSVHLITGDDEALVADALADVVGRLLEGAERSLAAEEFDGDDYDLGAVVVAARTPPFLTERRIVVARGLQRFGASDVDGLAAALADLPATTDLVLSAVGGRLPKRLLDAAKSVGAISLATDPPSGARDRRAWLDERLGAGVASVRLEPAARAALTEQLGDDLGRLNGVLDTLAAAYGEGARVSADDVAPFLGEAGSVPPWELTDALDRGDTATALDRLARMLGAGGRHPLQVMATLHAHYGRMLRLDGAEVGDDREAAVLIGAKSPFAVKKAMDATRRLGHGGIVRAVTLLADADLDLRGAKDWPEHLVVEVLVARLSRLAPAPAAATRRPARSPR